MPLYSDHLYYGGYGGGSFSTLPFAVFGVSRLAPAGYLGTGRLGAGRYTPLLPTITETSSPILSPRRTPLPRIPSPSAYVPRPVRIDTADIDVSSPRNEHRIRNSSTGIIRRERSVVRLHTKKLKDNPALREKRRLTPGEKLVQKFLIRDKAEEARKEERRKKEEEELQKEKLRLQEKFLSRRSSENEHLASTTIPTRLTEVDALELLLSSQEEEDLAESLASTGSEVQRIGTVKENTVKEIGRDSGSVISKSVKRKTKKRTTNPVGSSEEDVAGTNDEVLMRRPTLQRRNTVKLRRNSADVLQELECISRSRRNSNASQTEESDAIVSTPISGVVEASEFLVQNKIQEPVSRLLKFRVEDIQVEETSLLSPKSKVKKLKFEVIMENEEATQVTEPDHLLKPPRVPTVDSEKHEVPQEIKLKKTKTKLKNAEKKSAINTFQIKDLERESNSFLTEQISEKFKPANDPSSHDVISGEEYLKKPQIENRQANTTKKLNDSHTENHSVHSDHTTDNSKNIKSDNNLQHKSDSIFKDDQIKNERQKTNLKTMPLKSLKPSFSKFVRKEKLKNTISLSDEATVDRGDKTVPVSAPSIIKEDTMSCTFTTPVSVSPTHNVYLNINSGNPSNSKSEFTQRIESNVNNSHNDKTNTEQLYANLPQEDESTDRTRTKIQENANFLSKSSTQKNFNTKSKQIFPSKIDMQALHLENASKFASLEDNPSKSSTTAVNKPTEHRIISEEEAVIKNMKSNNYDLQKQKSGGFLMPKSTSEVLIAGTHAISFEPAIEEATENKALKKTKENITKDAVLDTLIFEESKGKIKSQKVGQKNNYARSPPIDMKETQDKTETETDVEITLKLPNLKNNGNKTCTKIAASPMFPEKLESSTLLKNVLSLTKTAVEDESIPGAVSSTDRKLDTLEQNTMLLEQKKVPVGSESLAVADLKLKNDVTNISYKFIEGIGNEEDSQEVTKDLTIIKPADKTEKCQNVAVSGLRSLDKIDMKTKLDIGRAKTENVELDKKENYGSADMLEKTQDLKTGNSVLRSRTLKDRNKDGFMHLNEKTMGANKKKTEKGLKSCKMLVDDTILVNQNKQQETNDSKNVKLKYFKCINSSNKSRKNAGDNNYQYVTNPTEECSNLYQVGAGANNKHSEEEVIQNSKSSNRVSDSIVTSQEKERKNSKNTKTTGNDSKSGKITTDSNLQTNRFSYENVNEKEGRKIEFSENIAEELEKQIGSRGPVSEYASGRPIAYAADATRNVLTNTYKTNVLPRKAKIDAIPKLNPMQLTFSEKQHADVDLASNLTKNKEEAKMEKHNLVDMSMENEIIDKKSAHCPSDKQGRNLLADTTTSKEKLVKNVQKNDKERSSATAKEQPIEQTFKTVNSEAVNKEFEKLVHKDEFTSLEEGKENKSASLKSAEYSKSKKNSHRKSKSKLTTSEKLVEKEGINSVNMEIKDTLNGELAEEESGDADDEDTNTEEEEPVEETPHIRTSTSSDDSGFDSQTSVPGRCAYFCKDCDVNCHKKCEKLMPHLCGVNQKLIVEALTSVKRVPSTSCGNESSCAGTPHFASNPILGLDSNEEPIRPSFNVPPASTIPRFRKYTMGDFQFLKVLGKGSFGKVLLAELKGTDRYYAVKCLKKDVVLEDNDVECTLIERKVLALGTKHPYLCHLFCTFQTESHLLFVLEYLNGGDLMFHIQQSGHFSEPRARFYAAEIISGLKFLHKKGIIYRDLKLDNILLDYEGHVRIADFGMCKLQIFLDRTADTFCGTPDYMAPEIIKGLKYNQCVDWWSFGILLYEMLIGVSPFSGCDDNELFWSICNEQPHYPRFLTHEASNILTLLLEKDASKRLGNSECIAGDVIDQPFFRSIDWEALERRGLEPPFKPKVQHPLDVQYFEKTFTEEKARLTPIDKRILETMDQTQFQGFSYTNPYTTDY